MTSMSTLFYVSAMGISHASPRFPHQAPHESPNVRKRTQTNAWPRFWLAAYGEENPHTPIFTLPVPLQSLKIDK